MNRTRGTRRVAVVLGVALVLAACSSSEPEAPTATPREYRVGITTATFRNGAPPLVPGIDDRQSVDGRPLETTIFYPARGAVRSEPVADAPAARGGPFPLVVFAHGFGGSPDYAEALLVEWARAGYVVAAPRFPNTSDVSNNGPDAGDFVNQPGDVTAVINAVLRMSDGVHEPFAGLVETDAIGVAGHSLGGITTLGVAANSCCQDPRIGAAVVLAGDPLTFPEGEFDYAKAPPLLLVHGTDDNLVPYDASVDVFNLARGPKGVLTIKGGDHGAPVDADGASFPTVVRTTVAFFDAFLHGDGAARDRLSAAGRSPTTRFVFAAKPGSQTTIPTAPKAVRALEATVTPNRDLVNGQTVTVKWSGYTPGKTINIVQCSNQTPGDSAACDLQKGRILQPNPTGEGELPLEIVVGPVGNGACEPGSTHCQIVINDGGSLDPDASLRISISIATA